MADPLAKCNSDCPYYTSKPGRLKPCSLGAKYTDDESTSEVSLVRKNDNCRHFLTPQQILDLTKKASRMVLLE